MRTDILLRVQPKVLQHFHHDERLQPKSCSNNENELQLQAYLNARLKLIQMQTLSSYQLEISFPLAQYVASPHCKNTLEKGTGDNSQFQDTERDAKWCPRRF